MSGTAAPLSPRALALRVLGARYGGSTRASLTDPGLAGFQQEAVERLAAALAHYRGAFLADSVGLGKTHVGAALVRRALAVGERVLIVTPPVLRRTWQQAVRDARAQLVSHGALTRLAYAGSARGPDFVVVDEAHAFRNPSTRRFRALARITRHARVLLVTATPVNNSLDDLYWLLRLFAGDDAFAAVGVPDLRACFEHARRTGGAGRIPTVLAQVMVRRTRSLLLDADGTIEMGKTRLQVPRREPPRPMRYPAPGGWRALLRLVEGLELAGWAASGRGADVLLRMLLLRRAESSRAAALASFTALDSALRRMQEALDAGLDPVAARRREAADQLGLDALLLAPLPAGVDRRAVADAVTRDRARVAAACARLRAAPDGKIAALRTLLAQLGERPVVIFTEFRETALELHRSLYASHRVGLVHGGGALLGRMPAGRRTVIERFAPVATGARGPPARERVQVLISTDVLAEGLDLHDAADVISFDLPWNPVRLIQRIGRVDRIGSRHESIRSYHFLPDHHLERTLGLMRRLRRKLHAIGGTIGLDAPVLGGTDPIAGAVLNSEAAVLASLERGDALACDIEERLRAAWRRSLRGGVTDLPLFAPAPAPTRAALERADALRTATLRADVPLPATLARGRAPACCVFLSVSGCPRAVVVRDRRAVEDERCAGAALLAALEQTDAAPLDGRLRRYALSAIRRARALAAAPVAPATFSGVRRLLRRRLLALLERVPGGATPEECRRVEKLVKALDAGAAGTEIELRRRSRQLRSLKLEALCRELEGLLLPARPTARPTGRAPLPEPWAGHGRTRPERDSGLRIEVLGVLFLEGRAVDPPGRAG